VQEDKSMKTNRDLYKAIEALIKEKENTPIISLEEYLISLLGRGLEKRKESELSPDEFDEDAPGFSGWQAALRRQIKDLKDMKRNGQLHDKYRYFGIDAPGGQRWYNFDPCTYAEACNESVQT
jgi:hypothetical protein